MRVTPYPIICLLLLGVAGPAMADDLSVTSILTAPVTTSKASNGTPGNITIDTNAGISTTVSGATVTIDTAHTVESLDIIQNAFDKGNAIGLHILSGSAGTFIADATSASVINVGGAGTNNIGLLLDGNSSFTGTLTLGIGSSIVVTGDNSTGLAINAPL